MRQIDFHADSTEKSGYSVFKKYPMADDSINDHGSKKTKTEINIPVRNII